MTDIVQKLREVGAHDWRRSHLAHTSDTAKEAADEIEELREALRLTGRTLSRAIEEINSQFPA